MNRSDVVVIDYGMGNLLSVRRGLEHCGASVEVSSDPKVIQNAVRVVLPGVGAFSDAMSELQRLQLVDVVREVALKGRPVLGICLGMQMLLDESEEFGRTSGLGLIHGKVVPLAAENMGDNVLKVPHVGWNELYPSKSRLSWSNTLLREVNAGESVYFVHSFIACATQNSHCISYCNYENIKIPAVLAKDNIVGCQFHPEKSGETGLKIIKGFLSL